MADVGVRAVLDQLVAWLQRQIEREAAGQAFEAGDSQQTSSDAQKQPDGGLYRYKRVKVCGE